MKQTILGKKCVSCGQFFTPDPRAGGRQKNCKKPECQAKRKRKQEERWRRKNPTYFQGRYDYVKNWRAKHPGYQKRWLAGKRKKIQTQIHPKPPIKSMRIHIRTAFDFDKIQTQILKVTQAGQAFWVDGAGMQAA